MPHVYRLEDATIEQPTIVTIGVFDGVHRGHQALIQRLIQDASAHNRQSVVLTFHPHPDVVLRGIEGRYYLMTPEQRADLLLNIGVDWVVTHPFNDAIRQVRAADFVDQMQRYLKLAEVWVGADFALGYQREGNIAYLTQRGQEKGFSVQAIELVTQSANGPVIKSSAIRDMLAQGQVAQVREWLGRAYSVHGTVVRGDQRGRTIGFPTANLDVWAQQIIPANGVYAGWASVDETRHQAVTNIGVRPTFAGDKMVTVEAHLLDFSGDLYGKQLRLTFEARLRDERKFDGIEALKAQLHKDVQAGRDSLRGGS